MSPLISFINILQVSAYRCIACLGKFIPSWCSGKWDGIFSLIYLSDLLLLVYRNARGFPGGSMVRNMTVKAGDAGLIPGLGRFPGEGNGNPLQYSCLGNPVDKGAW